MKGFRVDGFRVGQSIMRWQVRLRLWRTHLLVGWLRLRYGDKPIPEKVRRRFMPKVAQQPQAQSCLNQVLRFADQLTALGEHYRLDQQEIVALQMVGRYLSLQSRTYAEAETVYNAIFVTPSGEGAYELFLNTCNIPEHKLRYFQPPEPYRSYPEWLRSFAGPTLDGTLID